MPHKPQPHALSPVAALRSVCSQIGIALLLFVLCTQLTALISGQLSRSNTALLAVPAFSLSLTLLFYLFSLTVPILWLVHCPCVRTSAPFSMHFPARGQFFPSLGICLGAAALSNLFSSLLVTLLEQISGHALPALQTPNYDGLLPVTLTFLCTAAAPAVMEELLFRGLILRALRRFGERPAILLTALFFTLCHSTVGQLLPAFVIGLCLGYVVLTTRSLLTSMLIHFLYNAAVTAVTLLGGEDSSLRLLLSCLLIFLCCLLCLSAMRTMRRRELHFSPLRRTVLAPLELLRGTLSALPLLASIALLIFNTLSNLLQGGVL